MQEQKVKSFKFRNWDLGQIKMAYDQVRLEAIEASLLNTAGNVPLHKRFRALFTLKSLKNEEAVKIISKGSPSE